MSLERFLKNDGDSTVHEELRVQAQAEVFELLNDFQFHVVYTWDANGKEECK